MPERVIMKESVQVGANNASVLGDTPVEGEFFRIPDPVNSHIILKLVGTWSENDPSWEVRTLPKIPTVLPYHSSTVTLEPYHSPVRVAYVPILTCTVGGALALLP